eukprot:scaffold394_cov166-Amphora_coffeaeformis.AAC.12
MNPTGYQTNLLPTKVSQSPKEATEDNLQGWKGNPNGLPRWTAQPVLTWVESLAAATEAGERKQAKTRGGIMVDNVRLSTPATVPPSAPWALKNPALKHPCTPLPPNRRQCVPMTGSQHWDLCFLGYDADPRSSPYVRQITSLVVQIDLLTDQVQSDALIEDYPLAHDRFERIFFNIIETNYESKEEKRLALTKLYEDTIAKFQDIIDAVLTGKKLHGVDFGSLKAPPTPPTVSFDTHSDGKKDLSKFMTAWLRDNWTNPYPDDEGLAEMAHECGTTPPIVSNWLINARTRKWRPAIVKAVELNRPADMLLEDSLCIFDGRKVAPLEMDEDDDEPDSKRIKHAHSST